jgi:transcription antitermination protein NusB
MISRRLLRIKILQILYSYFVNEDQTIEKTEKELFFSINKTYELYNYLLILIIEIADFAENKISVGKDKLMPTFNDLHPITKFVENRVIKQLIANKQLKTYINNNKISWANHAVLIRRLYKTLIGSNFYKKYQEEPELNYNDDKELIIKVYKFIILNSEELNQLLEDLSIYWNDDIDFVVGMIIKTIKSFDEETGADFPLFELFQNEDDIEFAKTLLRKTILYHNDNKQLIEKYTKNWDVERIASIDIHIIEMAMVEITEISSIPVRVSFNEYIEIAKYYSTDKSSHFINGILDKIISSLKEENKIKKKGRGLMEGKKMG